MRDSNAAKNLLYRRLRALANYEKANKDLDKARAKNKDVGVVSDAIENFPIWQPIVSLISGRE
jgi:hypothetical protein